MGAFEFFLPFQGVLLALAVAELLRGLAAALGARDRPRLGWLTPLLALFLLLDVASFSIWAWAFRATTVVGWPASLSLLAVTGAYFLAAALVFPRRPGEWETLDAWYWARKRLVVAAVMLANAIVLAVTLLRSPPAPGDIWLWFALGIYWLPLAALLLTRSRRLDLLLLALLILQYAAAAAGLLPGSGLAVPVAP
jgi:hypothetical protein